MSLFEPNLVYPSDNEGGRYIELEGVVIAIDADLGAPDLFEARIDVRTEKGDHYGYCQWPRREDMFKPEIGMRATIRIYDAGGGWYPDNRILSMGGR